MDLLLSVIQFEVVLISSSLLTLQQVLVGNEMSSVFCSILMNILSSLWLGTATIKTNASFILMKWKLVHAMSESVTVCHFCSVLFCPDYITVQLNWFCENWGIRKFMHLLDSNLVDSASLSCLSIKFRFMLISCLHDLSFQDAELWRGPPSFVYGTTTCHTSLWLVQWLIFVGSAEKTTLPYKDQPICQMSKRKVLCRSIWITFMLFGKREQHITIWWGLQRKWWLVLTSISLSLLMLTANPSQCIILLILLNRFTTQVTQCSLGLCIFLCLGNVEYLA